MRKLLLVFSIIYFASFNSYASDPCAVVLCMYGKATGSSGGGDCSSAEKSFFKINSFGKKGRFNPSKTADARKSFLGSCPTANPKDIEKIIKSFGRIRG